VLPTLLGCRADRPTGGRKQRATGMCSTRACQISPNREELTRSAEGHTHADFSFPEEASEVGRYAVQFVFPKPGRYVMAIDFVVPENNNLNAAATSQNGTAASDVGRRNVFVSKYLELQVPASNLSACSLASRAAFNRCPATGRCAGDLQSARKEPPLAADLLRRPGADVVVRHALSQLFPAGGGACHVR
jgi:hypothetical protein